MSSNMPCSATAEELRTDAGTKSDMPQAEMSLREIAEAFVKDPDADVVGVIEHILKVKSASINHAGLTVMHMADHIIDFVEGQR